jgi:hypothetical protein
MPWEKLAMDQSEWGNLSETLAVNLRAALQVGGEDFPKPMSKLELERKSGVDRGVIAKLLAERAEGDAPANCDFKTLCALAAGLGVPLAMLLMTTNDWQNLLGAISALPDAGRAKALARLETETGPMRADVGIAMAFAQKVFPERFVDDPEMDGEARRSHQADVSRINKARHRAILTTTAVAQNGARYPYDLPPLTVIGALIGARCRVPQPGEGQ